MAAKRVQNSSLLAVLLVLVCALALPSLAFGEGFQRKVFKVRGNVFCDTCLAGFETSATTYISGARVKVICRDRTTNQVKYSVGGVTNADGAYEIEVNDDHRDDICDVVLISSPDARCAKAVPGRDRARVILTDDTGIATNIRLANAVGFQKETANAGCDQVMKMYQTDEEDV